MKILDGNCSRRSVPALPTMVSGLKAQLKPAQGRVEER